MPAASTAVALLPMIRLTTLALLARVFFVRCLIRDAMKAEASFCKYEKTRGEMPASRA